MQGQFSGRVGLTQATLPAGATRPAVRAVSPYEVSGRFDGDTVSVTLQTNACPIRAGRAGRQPAASNAPSPAAARSPYYNPDTSGAGPCPQRWPGDPPCSEMIAPSRAR